MAYPTGNEHPYKGKYEHCPKDCQEAIAKFDKECANGTIKFDKSSVMPVSTPDDDNENRADNSWARPHMMIGDIEP